MNKPEFVIIAGRASILTITHPQADYSHTCGECGECICLSPSSQRAARQHEGEVAFLCDVCARRLKPEQIVSISIARAAPKEATEYYDFTKKRPQ